MLAEVRVVNGVKEGGKRIDEVIMATITNSNEEISMVAGNGLAMLFPSARKAHATTEAREKLVK